MNPILLLILIIIANFVIYWIFFGQKKFNEKYGHNYQNHCSNTFGLHTNPADELKEISKKLKEKNNKKGTHSNKKLNKKEDLSSTSKKKRGK